MIRAGASTIDVAGILSSTANKILVESFDSVETVYRRITRSRPVNDFKKSTFYRLTANLEYEEVPASGKIPEGTLGEESYTASAKTYAKLLALSRTQIINDDLGAFDDIPRRLGRVRRLRSTGSSGKCSPPAALGFSPLPARIIRRRGNGPRARRRRGRSRDSVVFRNGGRRRWTDWATARNPSRSAGAFLHRETAVRGNGGSQSGGRGRVSHVELVERQVPAGGVGLFGERVDHRALGQAVVLAHRPDDERHCCGRTAFPRRAESPTVESADADFDELGILFRGFHDFGCALSEYRCGVMSLGEAE